jgi:hypothetical protein
MIRIGLTHLIVYYIKIGIAFRRPDEEQTFLTLCDAIFSRRGVEVFTPFSLHSVICVRGRRGVEPQTLPRFKKGGMKSQRINTRLYLDYFLFLFRVVIFEKNFFFFLYVGRIRERLE